MVPAIRYDVKRFSSPFAAREGTTGRVAGPRGDWQRLDRCQRQLDQADLAADRAVASFIGKIEALQRRWPAVALSYVFERLAHGLCTELSRQIDVEEIRNSAGEATIKLANALSDYRDLQPVDR